MFRCNCCGKRVPYNKIYTRASILFNGCKNCYDYLVNLLSELKPNKHRRKHDCVEKCKYFNRKYCYYSKGGIGTECIRTPELVKEDKCIIQRLKKN